MIRIAVIVILIQTAAAFALAAPDTGDDSTKVAGDIVDSTIAGMKYKSLFAERSSDSTRTQNPTTALFKSMLVPGWGQLGNKKYIKAVIIAGLETYTFATYWHYRIKTSDARKAFQSAESDLQASLYTEYLNARDNRNRYAWYTGSLIFISMFDAYVDAHLVNFPKGDKSISLKFIPAGNAIAALTLSYDF